MNRNLKGLLLSLFLILILTFSAVTEVSAENKLLIKNYKGSAEIFQNGDMNYQETFTYKFTGSWNGVTRGIKLKAGSSLKNLEVSEETEGSSSEYRLNNDAHKGETGVYKLVTENGIPTVYIFSSSRDTVKTFKLSYTITNAVVKHKDTAELYYKFIGEENSVAIENASIDISAPAGSKKSDLKIFAHGSLNGVSKIVDDRTVNLSVTDVNADRYIEGRLLFPLELVPDAKNTDYSTDLSSIMAEEKAWADEANAERAKARTLSALGKYASIILTAGLLALAILLQNKYGKEFKPDFNGSYYRELPDDCTPAVMSVLYNFGSVSTKDLSATILDLVRKRALRLELVNNEKKGIFRAKTEQDYLLYMENKEDSSLKSHEKFLIHWLVNEIGNGEYVSFQEIKNSSKDRSFAKAFHSNYELFVNKVKAESDRYDFFDRDSDTGKIYLVLAAGISLLLGILMFFFLRSPWALMLIPVSIIMIIMSIFIRRRSRNGSDMFARWKAFRKYLVDFSNLKEHDVPSIVLWEHYLVYAVSLGVAKKVIDHLKLIIKDEDLNNPGLTYMYMYTGMRHSVFDRLDEINSLTYQFEEVSDNIFKTAMTQNSSSSGGGGGFSSGGGGGGGGGGFGGF